MNNAVFTLEMENIILLKNGLNPGALLALKCYKAAATAAPPFALSIPSLVQEGLWRWALRAPARRFLATFICRM